MTSDPHAAPMPGDKALERVHCLHDATRGDALLARLGVLNRNAEPTAQAAKGLQEHDATLRASQGAVERLNAA